MALSPGFIDSGILYSGLLFVLVGAVFLYVNMGQQIQMLRWAVSDQRTRIRELEIRLGGSPGKAHSRTGDSVKEEVLRLHSLGRLAEEIARETGIRKAEVEFFLKVNEQLQSAGSTAAIRKIS